MKAYNIEEGTIVLNRDFTELDIFVKDFLEVVKKHTKHLIVSGFVSISSGRTRGTEDVDVLIPLISKENFDNLFDDLEKAGFWCFQGNKDIAYPYFSEKVSIRFARENEMFPNMEVIPVDETRKVKFFELSHPQKMKVDNFEFNIPPIEFEILYKELILKAKKDIEDAKHLRVMFSEIIDEKRFEKYRPIILMELK
jgi:hypothetical protein